MSKQKSQRQLQVNERIKRIVAQIFSDNGLSQIQGGYVTILEADTSPDMKQCKIFINVFGQDAKKKDILLQLNNASPRIRSALGRQLTMKSTPEITFAIDDSSQNAINIGKIITEESKNFENT